jgi:hypothetical protein
LPQEPEHDGYEIGLTPDAADQLAKLPPWLQGAAESHMFNRIAPNPVGASIRVTSVNGRAIGAYSSLQVGPIDGYLHQLTFIFRYCDNEKRIEITSIGYMPVEPPMSDNASD